MSTPYEVPLTANAQTLEVQLAGVTYRIEVQWNPVASCWVLNIRDVNGVDVLLGIPIVTGIDLLAPYAYLGFGGSLVAQTDHDANAVPTFDNLGSTGHLYFVVA